jgi:hypothetical protein
MLVITANHKNPIRTLNHNSVCTTCFNIYKVSVLLTDLICGFRLTLIKKTAIIISLKMFWKEQHVRNKHLPHAYTTHGYRFLILFFVMQIMCLS